MRKKPPAETKPTKQDVLRLTEEERTKVSVIQCPVCFDLVYSRALYDHRYCTCGKVSIDKGGEENPKIGWAPDIDPASVQLFSLFVPFTKKEIYDDWNSDRDHLGIIPVKNLSKLRRY